MCAPAFDFSNVFPSKISFKRGGVIAALIALVLYPFAPWEGDVAGFVNAVGATMGPLLGVILVDYYLIARQRVDVPQLYLEHGTYRFLGGWNINALVATAIGALFSSVLPHIGSILPAWWRVYGWFFGVAIGGLVYFGMERLRPRRGVRGSEPQPEPVAG